MLAGNVVTMRRIHCRLPNLISTIFSHFFTSLLLLLSCFTSLPPLLNPSMTSYQNHLMGYPKKLLTFLRRVLGFCNASCLLWMVLFFSGFFIFVFIAIIEPTLLHRQRSYKLIRSDRNGENFHIMRSQVERQLYLGDVEYAKRLRKDYVYSKFYDEYDLNGDDFEELRILGEIQVITPPSKSLKNISNNDLSEMENPNPIPNAYVAKDEDELLFATTKVDCRDCLNESAASYGAPGDVVSVISNTYVVVCRGAEEIRGATRMLTSLYTISLPTSIRIYVISDLRGIYVIERFISTWKHPSISIELLQSSNVEIMKTNHTTDIVQFFLKREIFLQANCSNIILVSPFVVFNKNPNFSFLDKFNKFKIITFGFGNHSISHREKWSVVLIKLNETVNLTSTKAWLKALRLSKNNYFVSDQFYVEEKNLQFRRDYHSNINPARLMVQYRDVTHEAKADGNTTQNKCSKFSTLTRQSYLTHLYFIDRSKYKFTDYTYNYSKVKHKLRILNNFNITMVTVFTMDRLEFFEKQVQAWSNAISAVFYGSAEEISRLAFVVSNSSILNGTLGEDVTYHVVYKPEVYDKGTNQLTDYMPINYLRNIGLNESLTPYVFYNDVDLIPVSNMNNLIAKHLMASNKHSSTYNRRTALVVPALESMTSLKNFFPDSKYEVIWLMESFMPTITGYKAIHGWKSGHSPTDYSKWQKAYEPYTRKYKHQWEPYVVLPTHLAPLYDERFPERMYDKVHYALMLHAMGFQFKILHDAFISKFLRLLY